ncbi:MAG: succinate dehydrogenase cytochrome b subunit [Solitalea-like symbiont of Tyrophagus putrescentiae]
MYANKNEFLKFITSTVARKYVMGITGLFLIVFLVVHASINALIFVDSSGTVFNNAAHFMSSNPLMRIIEIVLFLGFIVHIIQSLVLTIENKKSRRVSYAKTDTKASKWYSRSMGLLGTLILIFLIIHLLNFWTKTKFGFPNHLPSTTVPGLHDLWAEMQIVFSNPYIVLIYVLACISLSYHLLHGFSSAFQSLGVGRAKYVPIIKAVGYVYAIFIPLLYASMPIYVYFFVSMK